MQRAKLIYHLKLLYCVFTMMFIQFLIGCTYSYTPNLMEELRCPTSIIRLTIEEESWITSIPIVVCLISLPILGILMDKIGRKYTLIITYVPMIISWIIFVYSNSFEALLISKIILGFSYTSISCEFVYISEICSPDMRTIYCSSVSLFVGAGMLLESVMSIYLEWTTVAAIMSGVSVIGFVGMFAVPESPTWLRAHGRTEEARKVERWFDPTRPIAADNDNGLACPGVHQQPSSSTPRYWSLFADRTVWLPASIMFTYYLCQQASGVYVLMYYSSEVFQNSNISLDGISTTTIVVYLAVARVVGGLCFISLYRVRNTTLSAVSAAGMAVSLFVAIVYGKIFADVERPPFAITPIIGFVSYMFFGLLGVLPLPWILGGEVFPLPIRGVMNGIMQTCGFVLMFIFVKLYPSLVLHFGMEYVWSIVSMFCVLTVLFSIFIMPETKGKSLEEILSYFESRAKTIKNNIPT